MAYSNNATLNAAKAYHDLGLYICPTFAIEGKEKRQKWPWTKDEKGERIPFAWDQIELDLVNHTSGIGVFGGKTMVPGQYLEILDIETEDMAYSIFSSFPELREYPCVKTPSGGVHVWWLCDLPQPSRKLASELIDDGTGEQRIECLVETRGQGAYALAPGSNRYAHPSGQEYQWLHGTTEQNLKSIDSAKRLQIIRFCEAFNEVPEVKSFKAPSNSPDKGNRLGDKYDRNADWEKLLVAHGWKFHSQTKDVSNWTRPGKPDGISATLNYYGDNKLYCFSSATKLTQNHSYSPSGFRCVYEFDGDWNKLIKKLVEEDGGGYNPPPALNVDTYEFESTTKTESNDKPKSDKPFLLSLDELMKMPDPIWQVGDHFTEKSLVVLFGASESFKSFIAIDMGLCIATGKPYLDRHEVKQGKVLYICSEGHTGLKRRVKAWAKHHNKPFPNNFVIAPQSFDLRSNTDQAYEILKQSIAKLGTTPDLIVVDTMARNLGGGDVCSSKEVQQFVGVLDYLRQYSTVMVVHHTGWTETERVKGATNLKDSADTCILVKRDGEIADLIFDKQKDAESRNYRVIAERVELDLINGIPDTSLVIEYTEQDEKKAKIIQLVEDILEKQSVNQEDLVKAIQNRWQGDAPGKGVIRDYLSGLIGSILMVEKGDKNSKKYKLISQV